jgi:hypothetical protein
VTLGEFGPSFGKTHLALRLSFEARWRQDLGHARSRPANAENGRRVEFGNVILDVSCCVFCFTISRTSVTSKLFRVHLLGAVTLFGVRLYSQNHTNERVYAPQIVFLDFSSMGFLDDQFVADTGLVDETSLKEFQLTYRFHLYFPIFIYDSGIFHKPLQTSAKSNPGERTCRTAVIRHFRKLADTERCIFMTGQ